MLERRVSQDSKNMPKGKHQVLDPLLPLETAKIPACFSGNCLRLASTVTKDQLSVKQAKKTSARSLFYCMPSFDVVSFPAFFCHSLPSAQSRKLLRHAEALTAVMILVFLCLSLQWDFHITFKKALPKNS